MEKIFIDPKDQEQKVLIEKFLSKPEKYQRLMVKDIYSYRSYNYKRIWSDGEKTVVSYVTAELKKHGTRKAFVKHRAHRALTYTHKGSSNARIRLWAGTGIFDAEELVEMLINEKCPENIWLYKDKTVKEIMTLGLMSRIVSGKANSIEDCVKYYMTYSLRAVDVKLPKTEWKRLINVIEKTRSRYLTSLMLQTAKSKRDLLDLFESEEATPARLDRLNHLLRDALALDLKIDWSVTRFEMDAIKECLSKKENWAKDFLGLWEGGLVLKRPSQSITNSQDDFPF